jgi:hypothetical protein
MRELFTHAAMRPALFAAVASILTALAICAAPNAFAQQSQSTYLRWTASSTAAGNPSLTYNIYRASSCAGTFAKINAAAVTATTYLDNQPAPGSYCYQVTAVLNGVESTPSNDATATILIEQQQAQQPTSSSSSTAAPRPPASAKVPCAHGGDLVEWIRCVADKARAKIAPPLPVH